MGLKIAMHNLNKLKLFETVNTHKLMVLSKSLKYHIKIDIKSDSESDS